MRKGFSAAILFWVAGTALAAGPDISILARTCNNCHGVNGVSAGMSMPSIGGLPRHYLADVMKQWKYDERSAATMNRIVKGLTDDEINGLADYFSRQPWVPSHQPVGSTLMKKGKAVIFENCEDCHGATGNDPDEDAPRINGQWAKYMELELEKYREEEFSMPHRKMKKTVRRMKPAELPAAAHYFGAQGK